MSDQVTAIDPNFDPCINLGFIRNADGSITRLPVLPESPASSDPCNRFHFSKDMSINQRKNTWVRVFVPRKAFDSSPSSKFPVIIYFPGGGFIMCSPATSEFDNIYTAMVTELPAVILSVAYRRAPEHRLPAAYDDCMEALHWIKNCDDEWVTKYADISNCFLMGTSAGGNICYHVGLRAASGVDDLKPLVIKGLIFHHVFFGGTRRTGSELRLANDEVLPLSASDIMWELSLPVGVDRDHPFCNPTLGMKSEIFEQIKGLRWKVLVIGCHGDPLIDRQIEFLKKLEENGLPVEGKFDEGGYHGIDLFEPSKLKALCKDVKDLVLSAY